MRILIVEDDHTTRRVMERLLTAIGFTVASAADVAEARSHLSDPPHCMLLDYELPDGPGTEIARAARERGPDCRIAYITGSALLGELPFKADMCFIKPIQFHEVLN